MDGKALIGVLAKAIPDVNEVRPHGSLGGLTPDEAYRGVTDPIAEFRDAMRQARLKRPQINTQEACSGCVK